MFKGEIRASNENLYFYFIAIEKFIPRGYAVDGTEVRGMKGA